MSRFYNKDFKIFVTLTLMFKLVSVQWVCWLVFEDFNKNLTLHVSRKKTVELDETRFVENNAEM